MKKFLYSFIMACALISFSACEDETSQDPSVVTYYATLELEGDELLFWDMNTPYVDPGYVSEMQGEDVTDQVVVSGNVDYTKAGIYNLVYTMTNKDGFSVTRSRTVMVSDPTPSPIESGYWTTAPGSYRELYTYDDDGNVANTTVTPYSGYSIIILQLAPGRFYISDFLGGYYDQRAGYGSSYAMVGEFLLNDDNTITPLRGTVAGWGDAMEDMRNGQCDPETGMVSFDIDYAGMTFYITLNK